MCSYEVSYNLKASQRFCLHCVSYVYECHSGLLVMLVTVINLRFCRAPDGSCLLTCNNDNKMRLYNLPTELSSNSEKSSSDLFELVRKLCQYILYHLQCMKDQI